jgi:hypothetical protein
LSCDVDRSAPRGLQRLHDVRLVPASARAGSSPLWIAIATSWGIAFFEYCLDVPANRFGYARFSLVQLKTVQE